MTKIMETDWNVVSIGGALALLSSMPLDIQVQQFVVFTMFVTDTVSGVVRAGIEGNFTSKTARIELVSKLACYFIFVMLAFGATIAGKTWIPFMLAYITIIGIEFASIVENTIVLAKHGRVKSETILKLLRNIAPAFAVSKDDMDRITTVRVESTSKSTIDEVEINSISDVTVTNSTTTGSKNSRQTEKKEEVVIVEKLDS